MHFVYLKWNLFYIFIKVPLLHVLSAHVRVLTEGPLWRSWATLCGLQSNDSAPVPSHCRESIPSLLADPIALMLKYILLAPLHLDQGKKLKWFSLKTKKN